MLRFSDISKRCARILLGSAILSFGLYNIHAPSQVTEGGILGLSLLLDHWFSISPAITSAICGALCYLVGWRILGRDFLCRSILATAAFSCFYAVFEQFPPLWPTLPEHPLTVALLGAAFVGVGCGLCVRAGGAPSGDDALAMGLSRLLHLKIQWIYLMSDLLVLGLSMSYIPLSRLSYSLLTVILSGQLVGWIENFHLTPKSHT